MTKGAKMILRQIFPYTCTVHSISRIEHLEFHYKESSDKRELIEHVICLIIKYTLHTCTCIQISTWNDYLIAFSLCQIFDYIIAKSTSVAIKVNKTLLMNKFKNLIITP